MEHTQKTHSVPCNVFKTTYQSYQTQDSILHYEIPTLFEKKLQVSLQSQDRMRNTSHRFSSASWVMTTRELPMKILLLGVTVNIVGAMTTSTQNLLHLAGHVHCLGLFTVNSVFRLGFPSVFCWLVGIIPTDLSLLFVFLNK